MSELPILPSGSKHPHEELILVALRLDAQHDGPQFYTLLSVGGTDERPLVADGRLLFFTRRQLAGKALAEDPTLAGLGPPPEEIEVDVAPGQHKPDFWWNNLSDATFCPANTPSSPLSDSPGYMQLF